MTRLLAIVFLVLSLAACATTTRTETRRTYATAKSAAVGDDVLVTTTDGRRLQFRVTGMNDKTLQGKGVTVQRAEISSLKVATGTTTVTTKETTAEPAAKVAGMAILAYAVIVIVAITAIF